MIAAPTRNTTRAAALGAVILCALALPACSLIARHLVHAQSPNPETVARVVSDFGGVTVPAGYHILKAELATQNSDAIEKLDIAPDDPSRIFVIVLTNRTFVASPPFDYEAAYGPGTCGPSNQTIDATFLNKPVSFAPELCKQHDGKLHLAAGQNLPFRAGTIIVVAMGLPADFDPAALRDTIASIH